MRKINVLILMILLFCQGALTAQVEKGKFLIGSTTNLGLFCHTCDMFNIGTSYNVHKYTADNYNQKYATKSSQFNINPSFGFFLNDYFAVGTNLNYTRIVEKDENFKFGTIQYAFGPFLRYYLPFHKLIPYVQLGAGFGRLYSISGDDREVLTNNFQYGTGLGVAFPLGNLVTFDSVLAFDSLNMKLIEEEPGFSSKMIFRNFGLRLGFTLLIGNKKNN